MGVIVTMLGAVIVGLTLWLLHRACRELARRRQVARVRAALSHSMTPVGTSSDPNLGVLAGPTTALAGAA